ncbi:hypothetical protein FACS1894179_05870 [Bacteroidia bacterium]|nr:hypothetical protein FACS1894179_05870 [Bacteroidia bacterium]
MGEVSLKGINCSMNAIADKPFLLESVTITFKLRKKLMIACVDIGDISCFLQLESKKSRKELIIDIPDFTWNDIHQLLSENLTSSILQDLYSKDKLHLQICLKKLENVDIPFVHGDISYDKFSFYNRRDGKFSEVSKDYLIGLLYKRLNKQSGSYIKYENIPEDIIHAVICTEDPLFWSHKGIAPDFIGLAIASNLKERKIARGASTITMQLIRNLFLTHDRNLLRKAEESILALLLENYYKIDKQTIMELYMNVIEFAPDIYGLYDASLFYFDKKYTKLTLIEIITLTYIIPRPKHFYEALIQESSQLKRNLYTHIISYSHSLLHKGFITINKYKEIGMAIHFAEKFGMLDFCPFKKLEIQYALNQSLNKLESVNPNLVELIKEAIQSTSIPFIITEGVRTTERQKELYAQGRVTPGLIVTNCDGIKDKSNHQLKENGYGHAVDLYPYINGSIRIHEAYVPEILQIIAEHIQMTAQKMNLSVIWGGDWKMKDYPHFELRVE